VTGAGHRVRILVTDGCHLCEDACVVVAQVCESAAVEWSVADLADLDADTRSRWREYVPVVLVDGEVHDIFRVSADRLRAALT
jgi:Glutaredoxin-like domain (DUF836)